MLNDTRAKARQWQNAISEYQRSKLAGATKWLLPDQRRDGRVVECGGLENHCSERNRGFESLSLRHFVATFDGLVIPFFIAPLSQVSSLRSSNLSATLWLRSMDW